MFPWMWDSIPDGRNGPNGPPLVSVGFSDDIVCLGLIVNSEQEKLIFGDELRFPHPYIYQEHSVIASF